MALLVRPPGLPPVIEGFLNLRGHALPVIRLDRLFGQDPRPPGRDAPLIVLRPAPKAQVLLADRVLEVAEAHAEAFLPVRDGHSLHDCAAAEVLLAGGLVHLLDPARLLLEAEQQRLAGLQALADQHLEEWERCRP